MDTATHFAIGFGLAALAHLDPVVANNPGLAEAVMIGTVIGQQAPDFDGFTRLLGNATYIRNHRGASHSIPAIFIWTLSIFGLIQYFIPQEHWGHLLGWTFFAVFLHVFVDIFNAYGTQALRPFSRKWVALCTMFIFDPLIFALHIIGLLLWAAGAEPGKLFLVIYVFIALYYVKRYRVHARELAYLQSSLGLKGEYTLIPTYSWSQWTFVVKTPQQWYVGEIHQGSEPLVLDIFPIPKTEPELITVTRQDKKVQAFLSFTHHVHAEVIQRSFGYEVKWKDLRYRAKHMGKSHYMLVAVVYLDQDKQIRDSFVGWIHHSEDQLTKKLNPQKEIQVN
ncbi:metal-dependent hydrolase [Brevibacillus laterosporus]|uniref:metal-dependent hydrolase n=1 Tax=Brevibacillus laterosporus TaxID=1465 RepID=UPI000CE5669F|nr:metal-dependent hydrolase [Brevibacillus laterosporus]PPA82306.1 metal-dependent hydrolase [Brevibacillus laterosporus]